MVNLTVGRTFTASCKSTQIKVSRGLSLTLTATVREQKKSQNDCKVELPHLKIYNIYLLSPSAGQHTQTTLLEKCFIYSQLSPSRGRQHKTKQLMLTTSTTTITSTSGLKL